MDRKLARPGDERAGDEPDHPGQPAQCHHQEGDQLGRHHRRAHGDHWLLRSERPLPRFQPSVRLLRLDPDHHSVLGVPLLAVQTERLALTRRSTTTPGIRAAMTRNRAAKARSSEADRVGDSRQLWRTVKIPTWRRDRPVSYTHLTLPTNR